MSDLQEKASALLARIDGDQEAERSGRLSPGDRVMIFRLAAKGLSQDEIARIVGCSQPTVSRTLALIDTRKEARMILESGSAKLAQTVVDTPDGKVALQALGKLDVVREDAHGGGNSSFVLVVGQPGLVPSELEPPVIDVTAIPPDSDAT
jgi:hypothetical protein